MFGQERSGRFSITTVWWWKVVERGSFGLERSHALDQQSGVVDGVATESRSVISDMIRAFFGWSLGRSVHLLAISRDDHSDPVKESLSFSIDPPVDLDFVVPDQLRSRL